VDGTTTMSTHERKASIREFYGKHEPPFILFPFCFFKIILK
jgi:hypothetical protein